MGNLVMNKQLKRELEESFKRLDDEVKEIEGIYEEMDKYLYEIEKRIARLRRSEWA